MIKALTLIPSTRATVRQVFRKTDSGLLAHSFMTSRPHDIARHRSSSSCQTRNTELEAVDQKEGSGSRRNAKSDRAIPNHPSICGHRMVNINGSRLRLATQEEGALH
jgi:hypothetical protein